MQQQEQRVESATMQIHDYEVDTAVITYAEAVEYIQDHRGRHHPRRIQAWFDHCARIRQHPQTRFTATHHHG